MSALPNSFPADAPSTPVAAVLGGGFSGLSAALRLALRGIPVRLWERHGRLGGMNSWYERDGLVLDTGLHALTNFVPPQERSAPMNRVFRQLRIRREELELLPAHQAAIRFPGHELILRNDFEDFSRQIRGQFPGDAAGFGALAREVLRRGYAPEEMDGLTANALLKRHLASPDLREMLRFPVMFYGNPSPDDMPAGAYATMFRSVLMEGLCRPRGGIRPLLDLLEKHLRGEGAELRLGQGVRQLLLDGRGALRALVTDRGEEIPCTRAISTLGARETAALLPQGAAPALACAPEGEMCFLEAIFRLPCTPAELGFPHAVLFWNQGTEFRYEPPPDLAAAPESMLVCAPGNYGEEGPEARLLRLSAITSWRPWEELPQAEYARRKEQVSRRLRAALRREFPALAEALEPLDAFTPKTIRRFTGHARGAIYGSPRKYPRGDTGVPGLLLAGTDQGLLGVLGSMLSGILMANALPE